MWFAPGVRRVSTSIIFSGASERRVRSLLSVTIRSVHERIGHPPAVQTAPNARTATLTAPATTTSWALATRGSVRRDRKLILP